MKRHATPPLIISILLLFLLACNLTDDVVINSVGSNRNGRPPLQDLVFAGKVTDPITGKWVNDYLVIVFLNDREVGRYVSGLGKSLDSGHGVHNGFFEVAFPNVYELNANHKIFRNDEWPFKLEAGRNSSYQYHWFGELCPGQTIRLSAPEKQIEYAISVSAVPFSQLPIELQSHETAVLTPNDQIVARINNVGVGGGAPPQPTEVGKTSSNPIDQRAGSKMRLEAGEVSWTKVLMGFEGNRWEVWQQYVKAQVPGIDWDTFYEQIVLYNPHLEADGFTFYADKAYLLPEQK